VRRLGWSELGHAVVFCVLFIAAFANEPVAAIPTGLKLLVVSLASEWIGNAVATF